jgi:hypothetical protein
MKMAWFRDEWHDKPDWIEQAERTIDEIWRTSYRGQSGPMVAEEDGADQSDSELPRWRRKRRQRRAADDLGRDSMEAFQHEAPVDEHAVQDVIKYWAAKRTESRWKDLARMALDYLTIPAMSAEPERVFSSAKLTITDRRCILSDDAISALECLKSWSRDGLISAKYSQLQELDEMLKALSKAELEKRKQKGGRAEEQGTGRAGERDNGMMGRRDGGHVEYL